LNLLVWFCTQLTYCLFCGQSFVAMGRDPFGSGFKILQEISFVVFKILTQQNLWWPHVYVILNMIRRKFIFISNFNVIACKSNSDKSLEINNCLQSNSWSNQLFYQKVWHLILALILTLCFQIWVKRLLSLVSQGLKTPSHLGLLLKILKRNTTPQPLPYTESTPKLIVHYFGNWILMPGEIYPYPIHFEFEGHT